MLSIGLMSGTSMDGIDAALLETDGSENLLKELGNTNITYDSKFKILLKAAEYTIRKYHGNMENARIYYLAMLKEYLRVELNLSDIQIDNKLMELSDYLYTSNKSISLDDIIFHSTQLHSIAVNQLLNKTGYQAKQIDVIGYHGQTLFHQPENKISVIVGNGQHLANQLGIKVVNDFRSRDIAAGGQGAPFAPLYHYALAMRDKKIPVAIVNCGGIANISLINNHNELDLIAFDTGPGNGLIDKLVRYRTAGLENMDTNGKYGLQGKINEQVLQILYEKSIIKNGQNYFLIKPPKSLDIGDMQLIPELFALSIADACATLEAFTADTIVNSLGFITGNIPKYWVLAGGGWNNPVILCELKHRLQKKLSQANIFTADEIGWNSQAMEAQTFAYLAVRSLQNKYLSLPGTTRVLQPMTGGAVYAPT